MAPAAIGLALGLTALSSVPALADQVRHEEWWLTKLSVTRAWDTSQGAGVTVAILDTGVDASQPDLAGSVITGPDYLHSGQTSGGHSFGIHGTELASLIAGHGHGKGGVDGIVGVAPKARILSVRVTLDGGDPLLSDAAVTTRLPAAIAAGIRYAANNGAQVIDLPMDPAQPAGPGATGTTGATGQGASPGVSPAPGTSPGAGRSGEAGGSAAERAAVAYALARGVVLVAPAGDNGASGDAPNYPAAYPGVIAVGAFNRDFVKAQFSSHQRYVTLTAAGDGVVAALPGHGYATLRSTSAASAVVSGVAALIKAVYPNLTPAQVGRALTSSTVYHPADGLTDGSGYGTVDAARALAAAGIVATPAARQAGSGAAPRRLPSLPTAVTNPSLMPRLERDALISVAVLILLLLLVAGYAAMRRRRLAAPAAVPMSVRSGGQGRYASPATGSGDRMLEYFSAPSVPGGSASPAYPPAGYSGSSGRLASPGARRGADRPDATDAVAGRPGATDRPDAGWPASRPPPAQVTGSGARPTNVSGTPPWGPAVKPDSELPWASAPAFTGRASLQPRPAVPAEATWSPATDEPWAPPVLRAPQTPPMPVEAEADLPPLRPMPGDADLPQVPRMPQVPRLARMPVTPPATPPATLGRQSAEEHGGARDNRSDPPGSHPIYVWNPGSPTDTFPTLPADDS